MVISEMCESEVRHNQISTALTYKRKKTTQFQ